MIYRVSASALPYELGDRIKIPLPICLNQLKIAWCEREDSFGVSLFVKKLHLITFSRFAKAHDNSAFRTSRQTFVFESLLQLYDIA